MEAYLLVQLRHHFIVLQVVVQIRNQQGHYPVCVPLLKHIPTILNSISQFLVCYRFTTTCCIFDIVLLSYSAVCVV